MKRWAVVSKEKSQEDTLEDHFWRTITDHLTSPQHSDQHPMAKRLTKGNCPGEGRRRNCCCCPDEVQVETDANWRRSVTFYTISGAVDSQQLQWSCVGERGREGVMHGIIT